MADGKRQRIDFSEDLSKARGKLKKMDQLFQKAYLTLVEEKKNIYLTQGHGEMNHKGSKVPVRSASQLAKLLRALSYNVRTLDSDQGGFGAIPDDAHLLAIVGAAKQFTDNEIRNIESYVQNGGSLLVFLDVEYGGQERGLLNAEVDPLQAMLSRYGIQMNDGRLTNDKKHVSATRKKIDRTFLVANNFGSHVSVKSLAKNDEKLAVLIFQAGYLSAAKEIADGWKIANTVQTMATTFPDTNKNLAHDKGEQRKSYAIGMAAESDKGKIVVFSDATMVSNPLLQSPGNQIAILDGVKWLIGQEAISGEISSEEDVKIQHSKVRELFVFHISIYFVPVIILLIGFFVNRSRRKTAS